MQIPFTLDLLVNIEQSIYALLFYHILNLLLRRHIHQLILWNINRLLLNKNTCSRPLFILHRHVSSVGEVCFRQSFLPVKQFRHTKALRMRCILSFSELILSLAKWYIILLFIAWFFFHHIFLWHINVWSGGGCILMVDLIVLITIGSMTNLKKPLPQIQRFFDLQERSWFLCTLYHATVSVLLPLDQQYLILLILMLIVDSIQIWWNLFLAFIISDNTFKDI